MRSKVLAITLVAALLFAACGGAKKVDPQAYATDVCTTVGKWIQKISEGGSQIASSFTPGASADAGKEALVAFLGSAVDETDQVIKDLEAAGVPDVDGGEDVSETLIQGFRDAKAAFEKARDDASAVDTASEQEFATAVGQISTTMQTSLNEVSQRFQGVPQEIQNQFEDTEACAAIQGAAPAG